MKSVTIKDASGEVLIKVIHKKDGSYDRIIKKNLTGIIVEVRGDDNSKVMWETEVPTNKYGNQLEPPLRLEKLEAVRKVAEKIRSDDPYLSGSKVVIELEQALREAK